MRPTPSDVCFTGVWIMSKSSSINEIVNECTEQNIVIDAQIAYILATVEWETNHTFEPVKEAYWLSEGWRERNLRYYPFYGRGYVQLTWEENYIKYTDILSEENTPNAINLVIHPDAAMMPDVAKFILVHGFKHGTFTGRKISQYIDANSHDFYNARRCINGTDKATEIAAIAEEFLAGKTWDLPL